MAVQARSAVAMAVQARSAVAMVVARARAVLRVRARMDITRATVLAGGHMDLQGCAMSSARATSVAATTATVRQHMSALQVVSGGTGRSSKFVSDARRRLGLCR